MSQQNGNVLVVVLGSALLLASYSGACSGPPDPRAAASVDDQVTTQAMERCLPSECSVAAVRLADQYVGSCTEQWREAREVRDAQQARGIPDEAP